MSHIIKKYSNRKMYDMKTRKPITLTGIAALIMRGGDVQVIDNQTGDDLTTVTLAQIVLEQEKERSELISVPILLRELIAKGRSSISEFVERSLLASVESILLTEEKAKEIVLELMQKRRLDRGEGQRLLERLLSKIKETKMALQNQIETRIQEVISRMDVASQKDLSDLKTTLSELSTKIDALVNPKAEV